MITCEGCKYNNSPIKINNKGKITIIVDCELLQLDVTITEDTKIEDMPCWEVNVHE